MRVIAHRGASGYAPENTRASFDLALEMRADAIETDVQITADGALVLFHDSVVDRTSDGHGPIADFTLAELRQLDLGGWFASSFAGERVLTVEELLESYATRIPLVLEIKDPRAVGPLIDLLLGRGLPDDLEVTSFHWGALLDAQAQSSALRLGFLTPTFEPALIDRIARRGFAQICPLAECLTARRVGLAHAQGLDVRAWGVGHRDQVGLLTETGVDGATCNWPDWLVNAVSD